MFLDLLSEIFCDYTRYDIFQTVIDMKRDHNTGY
jgi:hypothetical protein